MASKTMLVAIMISMFCSSFIGASGFDCDGIEDGTLCLCRHLKTGHCVGGVCSCPSNNEPIRKQISYCSTHANCSKNCWCYEGICYYNIYIHKTEIIQNAGEIFPSVEGSSRPEHHNTENTLSVKTEVIQNAGKILSSVPDEIAYDPYKLYLYNKAIRKGKEKERVLRINIIGNYGQGKTSLARSITGQNSFDVTSTNGIEINRYACKRISGGSIVVNNSNNDDQDIINRIASVALTVRPTSSALELGSLVNELRTLGENVENPIRNLKQEPAPLVSKRTERKPKQEIPFSKTDLEVFADVLEKQKNNHDKILDIWDFGGQYIFYATHTLFHSKKALYLLVFDLTSPLDKIIHDEEFPDETGVRSMAYFAKYWIESIDAYTGPDTQVILVGTHKDLLANPELEKDEYFEHVRSLFDSTDGSNENQLIFHIQPEDFAVDNKNSPQSGIKELKEFLLKKHQELTQTIEIPARWIQLEKALNEHRKKKIITFQDVINIDKDNKHSIDDVDQIKLFLSYHHDKGTLFYFDEDQPSDPVVLDTKFLIDAFKCIITSEQFVKKSGARSEWKRLKNEGILSEKLVDIVWSKSEEFKPHKAVLLKFLKKHNILSQIVRLDQSTGCWKEENLYIVPSLLRDITDAEDTMRLFQENKHQSRLRYVLKFSRLSIVHVVYNRIVAASLGIWPLANFCNMHLIFEHVCVLEMLETSENKSTNHVAVIELRQECGTIELRLLNLLPQEIRRDLADQLRRFVESFVTQEFRKINCYQTENVKLFSRAYRCNHEDHKTDGGSIRLKELLENENLRCPDNYTHDRDFYRNAQCEWFEEATDEDEYPDIELTEKHFSLLSQAIGKNWELLGPLLEIRQTSMQHIKLDFPHSSSMQIFKMLCNWRDIVGEKATLDVLVNTFLMCPEVSFEWDIVRNIKDEFYRNNREKKPGFIKPVTDKICALAENLTLNCKVNKPISEVTWKKNGRALIQDERTKTFVNGYWHTLLIENVKKNDAATYECVFGNAVTQCDVKVQESDIQLEFTQKLVDKEVGSIARTVEFSCELNKDVEEVKWYFKKERILPSDKHRILSKGASHKLRIRDVTEKDEGKYLVEVEGKTSEAWLYVEDTEEERKLLLEHYKRQKGKEKSTDKRFGTVRTLYHCTADNESELSFGPNEIIRNVRLSKEPGWLEGSLDGKVGLIPENYIEYID